MTSWTDSTFEINDRDLTILKSARSQLELTEKNSFQGHGLRCAGQETLASGFHEKEVWLKHEVGVHHSNNDGSLATSRPRCPSPALLAGQCKSEKGG